MMSLTDNDLKFDYIMPFSFAIKKTCGTYIYANELFLEEAREVEIIGKTDFDLPWSFNAKEYEAQEKRLDEQKKEYIWKGVEMFCDTEGNLCKHNKLRMVKKHNSYIYVYTINLTEVHRLSLIEVSEYFRKKNKVNLSKREVECVKWMIEGKSSEEAAKILNISKRTVEWHITNIKEKFNCYKQSKLSFLIGKHHAYFGL